ncbi:MAG: hypothetical protein EOP42_20280 [Sphingobacteriaceae bacterium]|nr:MAG: hypothetical protein EOP42_20280 [Sphingobacteriaceae bacterium]
MTVSQLLRLYELTLKFIPDKDKAKEYVSRIEETVDQKFTEKERILATKSDIIILQNDGAVVGKEIAEAKVDIIKWLVATGIGITELVVTLIKMLQYLLQLNMIFIF